MAAFTYQDPFALAVDDTRYRQLTREHVRVEKLGERELLIVEPQGLTLLAQEAIHDASFYLRASHNAQVAAILEDVEASDNDKFVARAMLQNAVIAAEGKLPICQDTGTAIVYAKKGQYVITDGDDAAALSEGIFNTYAQDNLRYSQTVALSMYEEKNSGNNLPAQVDILADHGSAYKFLFIAKGGGSANKTYLFQKTKAVLNPESLLPFLVEQMKTLGTAACPPYHLAFVIGGTSAEATMKSVKLATTGYLDGLPTEGGPAGQAFRDTALEGELLAASRQVGFGAQFGGKYFAHDVRVIRLPRHGASCPIGMAVSCSAHRNVKAKIDRDGIWIEELDREPARWLAKAAAMPQAKAAVEIDLNRPMAEILAELRQHPVKTRLSLTGTLVVARDLAHAKIKERLAKGDEMPAYLKDHPVYYAGPAKTPEGMPSGSFGPTTAGRMDPYVDLFQSHGGSLIMIAKGNRSQQVTDACKKHGGFYLGSPGGPAALLAKECIRKVEVLEYPELGMEAIWRIEVESFPAFILVDDKGNDFFQQL